MPITINGDGTITGLSVGGLPDGSVDADTLAAGAAVPADGSITTAKLADGAASGSKLTMPAGSCLQTVFYQDTRRGKVISGGSWQDTGLSGSITTISANSKILLTFTGGGWYDKGQSSCHMNITFDRQFNGGSFSYATNASESYNGLIRMSGDGNSWNIKPYACQLYDNPSQAAGVVINYRVVAKMVSGSADYQNTDRGLPSLTLVEIAV